MPAPLISVIICAYNYAAYLEAAIDSALAQDWPNLEVIVVDDDSTDETPQILESYGDRIRSVWRPNGGITAATGTGIEHARGDFITFLDADDTWWPNRCRLLVEALLEHREVGLVYGDMEVVDNDGQVLNSSFRATHGVLALNGRPLGALLPRNHISAGSLMVRASLKQHFHPIPSYAAWQDWWIVTQVARVADIKAIQASVNRYRLHDCNMNLGADPEKFAGLLRVELPFRRWMLSTIEPRAVAVGDVINGVRALDVSLARIAGHDNVPWESLVEATEQERALAAADLAEARAALAAGDAIAAVFALVRTIGHDPADRAARALLGEVAAIAKGQEAGMSAELVPARRFVTFALAADLLAAPELLTAYGEAFSGADDATLVVGGVADQQTIEQLSALIARVGMDGETAADMVAIEMREPSVAALRLGRCVDALLTARPAAEPPAPCFGAADVPALRALARAAVAA